jgi:multidrug resistance efflux pump
MVEMADPTSRGTRPAFPGPKLAPGLTARRGSRADLIAVRNAAGREFEVYDSEWELAAKMNGEHTIEELARHAGTLGLAATPEQVLSVVRQLRAYGMIVPESAPPGRFTGEFPAVEPVRSPAQPEALADDAVASVREVFSRGEFSLARGLCEDALRRHPEHPTLRSYQRAIFAASSVLAWKNSRPPPQVSPGLTRPGRHDAELFFVPAEELIRQGRAADAAVFLETARRLDPENPNLARLESMGNGGSESLDEVVREAQEQPPMAQQAVEAPPAQSGSPPPPSPDALPGTEADLESNWSHRRALRVRRLKRGVVFASVGGAVVLALTVITYPLKVTSPADIRALNRSDVRSMVAGVITSVARREGELVKSGDTLAVLDKRDLQARMAMLEAQKAQATAELSKLKTGNRPEEIRRAGGAYSQRANALRFAQTKLTRTKKLIASGLASQEDLDSAKFEVEARTRELVSAKAEVDLLKAGARSEDVLAKQAELHRIEAEIELAQSDLLRTEIKSPIDGVLITPRFNEHVGKAVKLGDPVAEVADLSRMRVSVNVPESEIDAVELGQPVVLKVKSYPDREFHGKVDFIAAAATSTGEQKEVRVVLVAVHVANDEGLLRDEMTGFAEVNCGDRPLLTLISRRVIRWVRVRFLI